jgi:hypothetical protein
MPRTRPTRLAILLVAAAAAVVVLMAGVALGSAGRGTDRGNVETSSFRMRIPDVGNLDRLPDVKWSRSDDDVITVDGKKCPRSHPHKVGTSSSWSYRNDNGRVTNRSRTRTVCER